MAIICSLLLSIASTGLKPYQQRNIRIDQQKNILQAVGILDGTKTAAPKKIERLYEQNLKPFFMDNTGQLVREADRKPEDLPVWLYTKGDQFKGYVVPIDTTGLWGKIHAYLAFEADGTTIRGFTVFKHAETPGLGGEIEKRWFQKNFVGKKITNAAGEFVSIGIAKGTVAKSIPEKQQINFVDGISGATLTGKYLTAGLKQILTEYEPLTIKFQHQQADKVIPDEAGTTNNDE